MTHLKLFIGLVLSTVLLALASYLPGTTLSRGILLLCAAWAAWWSAGAPIPYPSNSIPPQNNSTPSAWVWGLIFLVALLLRLYRLTTLSAWPCSDELAVANFALEVAEKGQYRIFYTFAQAPPLYFWIEGFWFRIVGSSLTTLWLLPALMGFAAVVASFWAARQWLRGLPTLFLVVISATGFWPLYLDRHAFYFSFLLVLEWLLAGCFGRIIRIRPNGFKWYFFAGLIVGLGFWLASLWPLVALLGLFFVLNERQRPTQTAVFLSAASALVLPFYFLALQEGYGSHLIDVFYSKTSNHSAGFETLLLYLSAIFTGTSPDVCCYNPVRGGLLNPVSGAATLWGFGLLIRSMRARSSRWILYMFAGGLLPIMLTRGIDVFRITHILPYILLAATIGMDKLSLFIPRKRLMLCVLLFLFSSAALDFSHLEAYHQRWGRPNAAWTRLKSQEEYHAYRRLKTQFQAQGPGWIIPSMGQQDGLRVAVAPFDFPRKSGADLSAARWAGMLVNVHLLPFLKTRFPDSETFDLTNPSSRWPFSRGLLILPITKIRLDMLDHWERAGQALQQTRSLEEIEALAPLFKDDPFLQSCFQESLLSHYLLIPDISKSEIAVRNALRHGYPAAHFLNQMGILKAQQGDLKTAKDLYQQATKSPIDYTKAKKNLYRLEHPVIQTPTP